MSALQTAYGTFKDELAPVVVVKNIKRRFGGVRALKGVSFELPKGTITGLVGPNGAGKTTLFSILATLDQNYLGEVEIGGVSFEDDTYNARRRVGYVPDHISGYEHMSVFEYLVFFAKAQQTPSPRGAAEKMIEKTGLQALRDRPSTGLSKGNTQRLALARALIHEPDFLLLDEPAAGLDPRARLELKEILKRLRSEGVTILVSSHILSELEGFCDRVIMIEKGEILAGGAIEDLWKEQSGDSPKVVIETLGAGEKAEAIVAAFPSVLEVEREQNLLVVEGIGGQELTADIVKELVLNDIRVVRVAQEKENLEALFLTLTRGEVQ